MVNHLAERKTTNIWSKMGQKWVWFVQQNAAFGCFCANRLQKLVWIVKKWVKHASKIGQKQVRNGSKVVFFVHWNPSQSLSTRPLKGVQNGQRLRWWGLDVGEVPGSFCNVFLGWILCGCYFQMRDFHWFSQDFKKKGEGLPTCFLFIFWEDCVFLALLQGLLTVNFKNRDLPAAQQGCFVFLTKCSK